MFREALPAGSQAQPHRKLCAAAFAALPVANEKLTMNQNDTRAMELCARFVFYKNGFKLVP